MQANIENFLTGVLDNRRLFYIPVYQRNYSWKEEQCQRLFDDILKLYYEEYTEHFIGSIVWRPDESNSNNLGIIDGQQRLTTMFILTQALYDISDDERLNKRLKDILVDSYNKENRLKPIKKDNEVFKKILTNNEVEIKNKSSRIYLNYLYFKKLLEDTKLDYNKFFDKFNLLKVIKMELDYRDNPQVIFESINSTGMSLSIADLIRNYLLMNEDSNIQKDLFEEYWYKFEEKLGVENLVLFFEHYLNIKLLNDKVSRKDMYELFKKYYLTQDLKTKDFLSKIKVQVEQYEYLVTNKEIILSNNKKTKRINELRDEINLLNNTVSNMFLMQVLEYYANEKINEDELTYTFELVLTYIFRRSIVGLSTNSMQKVFRYLFNQVVNNLKNYNYKESLNNALITSKRNSNSRFPTDEEFYEALTTKNLYGKYRYLEYLLLKLENYNNKTQIISEELTIEHIMPQTLTSYWEEIIGENYKLLHEENVNDLGNLTLTSYNSNMSNFDFSKKKNILLEEAHIKLNEMLKDINVWDIKQIENRGKELAKIGLNIWYYPQIDKSIEKQIQNDKYNSITMDELLEEYKSLRLAELKIKDSKYKIKSYVDVLEKVIMYVIEISEEKFKNIFVESEDYIRMIKGNKVYIFTYEEIKIGRYRKLNNNLYFNVDYSGYDILKLVKNILTEFNVRLEEIELKSYS